MTGWPSDPHSLGQTPKNGDFARYVQDVTDAGSRGASPPGATSPSKPSALPLRASARGEQAPPDIDALLKTLGTGELVRPMLRALGLLATLTGGLLAVYAIIGHGSQAWMLLAVIALAIGGWLRKKGSM